MRALWFLTVIAFPLLAHPKVQCIDWLDATAIENFVEPTLPAQARLLLLSSVREIVEQCPANYLSKLKLRSPFSKAIFEEMLQSFPDQVIAGIRDREETPYATMEGSLGRIVQELKNNFKLKPSQQLALEQAVRVALARTQAMFSDVNSNCATKDFRKQLAPTIDQKNTSLCYAHTLAAEIGFKLLKEEARKDPISAAGIALVNQIEDVRRDPKSIYRSGPTSEIGGVFEDAFRAARTHGVCRESEISSAGLTGNPLKKIEDYRRVFPRLTEQQVKTASSTNPWQTFENLIRLACPKPVKIDGLEIAPVKINGWQERPKLVAEVQFRLSEGLVVGFGDSPVFGHAMTVVGQKYNPKTQMCDFIIRNSYGKDCGVSLANDRDKKIFQRCDGNGNFFISSAFFAENISETHTLTSSSSGSKTQSPVSK